MQSKKPNSILFYLAALTSCSIYFYVAYYLDRTNFVTLISLVALLIIAYYEFIRNSKELDFRTILGLAVLLRLIFLFSTPTLSDDIYRFLWDGYLWHGDVNPFSFKPTEIINMDIHIPGISEELYSKLNSKEYFSIYPPFNQFIFYLSTFFSVDKMWVSLVFIRLGFMTAEIGIILMLKKLIERFNFPNQNLALYALNPLIIIELTGNLHFEVWMIFFLLASLVLFLQNRFLLSALCFSLAISSKIWPLMFLPLFFGKLKFNYLLRFYYYVALFTLISFALILDFQLLENFMQSVNLYFQNFEFNASIFYIGRALGFYFLQYDPIQFLGPSLSIATFLFIMVYAFIHRNATIQKLPELILIALLVFLSMSSVVHPWYICPLIAFSVLGNFRFPIIWSFLIFLSYYAYSQSAWQESMILISFEYIIVLIALIWDLNERRKSKIQLA